MRIKENIFVVHAYRWGNIDSHSYICYIGTDKSVAIKRARDENEGRAGKYGVAVFLLKYHKENDVFTQELIEYFPSSYGETKPYCKDEEK